MKEKFSNNETQGLACYLTQLNANKMLEKPEFNISSKYSTLLNNVFLFF